MSSADQLGGGGLARHERCVVERPVLAARKLLPVLETEDRAAQPLLHLRGVALDPAIDRRMVDRNAAFRQHFLKVAIADRIATIPAHRPQDHITLEMAPLEIRHRSVRPISAKHAQASRFGSVAKIGGSQR